MNAALQLKDATKSQHRYLDHLSMMQNLLSPQLSPQDYSAALSVLGSWYQSMETQFDAYWHELNWQPKTPLILSDLTRLDPAFEIHRVCLTPPMNSNKAFALGILYVCEGATLGGQIIGPRVAKHLQRDDITSYYQCYGETCYAQWGITTTYLNTQLNNQFDLEIAIAGAQWAFSSLIDLVQSMQGKETMVNYG